MIRRLYIGDIEVLTKEENHVEICAVVNGVGYEVLVTKRSFKTISKALKDNSSGPYPIETFHRITETAEMLYGFSSKREYELFTMFLEVQGVGAKTGLSLVQTLTLSQVKKAIRDSDLSCFKSVNGVGPSTSQKILESLKSQFTKK